MSFLRKLGKGALATAKAAERLNEGMDEVLGEDRTRPGESFSMDNARQRSENFTKDARQSNKSDGFLEDSKDQDFFGENSEEDDDRRFI